MIIRLEKRFKRQLKRLRKHGGGRSWKKTPPAWLAFFRATATLPVILGAPLVAYLTIQLTVISLQHGLDWLGAALWAFTGTTGRVRLVGPAHRSLLRRTSLPALVSLDSTVLGRIRENVFSVIRQS